MTWHLFGAKPLPEPMMMYQQLDPLEYTSAKFQSDYTNTFENVVCNMAAILF